MVIAVHVFNPNPVFDRTLSVPAVSPGAVIRATGAEVTCGGKGINVARALNALGSENRLAVPLGELDRVTYEMLLAAESLDADVMGVPGGIRSATILLESETDRVTVINEAGYLDDLEVWDEVCAWVVSTLVPGDLLAIMGSLPVGLPDDALVQLVTQAHVTGARVLIDTAPTWLTPALAAAPDVITPNLDEAEACLGLRDAQVMDSHDLAAEVARSRAESAAALLVDRGAVAACVTAGSSGVALARDSRVHWIPTVPVNVVSTVGAGDSFVAGFIHQLPAADADESAWVQAVASGVASAAASCEQVLAGGVERSRYDELLPKVHELAPAGVNA